MIYIVEIPHQMPPKCWSVHNEEQALDAIYRTFIHRGDTFETFAEAIDYNGADLSSQIVLMTDREAIIAHADESIWQRHGGAAARDALGKEMLSNDIVPRSDVFVAPANESVLREFFAGIASCEFYDGLSHQLYLDLHDNTLSSTTEASSNTWLQRDDGSIVKVADVSGYCDTPAGERYDAERGDDLDDYGYTDWLQRLGETISREWREFDERATRSE